MSQERLGEIERLLRVAEDELACVQQQRQFLLFHVHDLNLIPSTTVYMRWGKGPRLRLRFTKTGDPKLEDAYARHFVWPGKSPFRFRVKADSD